MYWSKHWSKKVFFILFILITLVSPPGLFASIPTVAVLPFDNLTQNKELDWLKGGISETLTTKLTNAGLNTIERSEYDSALKDAEMAQKLGYDASKLLELIIRKSMSGKK